MHGETTSSEWPKCACGCGAPVPAYIVAHTPRAVAISARFWSKVEKTDTCWLWTGATVNGGHGRFGIAGDEKIMAHRFAYEEMVGAIPEGLVLDHLCRVPNCVNPAHLEPVTPRENTLRGVGFAAVNAKKTHCVNGHPLLPENVYQRPDRPGRMCRTCQREGSLKYQRSRPRSSRP